MLSGFLSFLVPGLGQAFCGEFRRARVYIFFSTCLFFAFCLFFGLSGIPNEFYNYAGGGMNFLKSTGGTLPQVFYSIFTV
jgi:TM2 domain-containing membrane protein YozV